MRYFEHMYFLHVNDALPKGFWFGQERSIQEMLGPPGSREAWSKNRAVFSLEFQTFVDALPQQNFESVLHPGASLAP